MKQEIERILLHTPYNSYDDLFGAVFSNKATIRLSNNACRQIAQTEKPILTNLGIHFGFIPSAIMTIAFSIYTANYLLLLILLVESIFSFAVYLLHNLKIKTWFIAGLAVIFDLFIIKLPLPVLILASSWLFNSWVVNWWQKKVYMLSVQTLRYDEEAFEWAYNSHNLLIEDCFGNLYSKSRQNELEIKAYERLLKVLKIGADVDNVDNAITKFSTFYLEKGKALPMDLYLGITNLPNQEKCEKLLKILELGIGVIGIENVTNRLIDFYKAKGIDFPNNI